MSDVEIEVHFGPAIHDRATLSTAHRRTLETFYHHPIAHNLDRIDALSLFHRLGSVEHSINGAITYRIGDEHFRVAKAHGHSLMTEEVMGLRHLLTRAGWGPGTPAAEPETAASASGDALLVVEESEARLFRLDVHAPDKAGHTIHPSDPHHILRHLSHHDQGRDEEQRNKEEAVFHTSVALALAPFHRIVLLGHGTGHSNAAQLLTVDLRHHHHAVFQRVVSEGTADISRLTDNQLLELGRRALTRAAAE